MSLDDEPLETLKSSKYDVERVLGRGGMGTVLQARHKRLGHNVAIKILAEDLRRNVDLVTRFEREARAASALSSPHAVRVFDIDTTDDGVPFMVMELLGGSDLGQLVASSGPQPIGTAVRWIIEACDAIAEAHRLGIVHRDIKPANLLLCDATGSIKVLDFGIAKRVASQDPAITANVAPLGTPQYMSPEQVRCSKDLDGRTDIWSLGVTLYELLTGRPPYDHDIAQACIAAVMLDPVPDPRAFRRDLPQELALVLLHALEKDPEARFSSVEELVQALLPFADRSSDTDLGSLSLVPTVRSDRSPAASHSLGMSGSLVPRRVPLGWLGGVVIALATLTSTTRFVDSDGAKTIASAEAEEMPSDALTVSNALPRAVDVEAAAESKQAAPPAKPATQPPGSAPSSPSKRIVPTVARPTPRPPLRATDHALSIDRPAHGGMSNPGF